LSSKNNSSSAFALSKLDTKEMVGNNSWKSYGPNGWVDFENIVIEVFIPKEIEYHKAFNVSCR